VCPPPLWVEFSHRGVSRSWIETFAAMHGFENFKMTKMTRKSGERGHQGFRGYTDVSRSRRCILWGHRAQGSANPTCAEPGVAVANGTGGLRNVLHAGTPTFEERQGCIPPTKTRHNSSREATYLIRLKPSTTPFFRLSTTRVRAATSPSPPSPPSSAGPAPPPGCASTVDSCTAQTATTGRQPYCPRMYSCTGTSG
jgi:hypothetical protein